MDNNGLGRLADGDWLQVPISPFRSYYVSRLGDVRRLSGQNLKGSVDRYGYRTVQLYYAGLPKRFKVHRLVCETFHGPCPEGQECAHLDGDKANNNEANLAWATRIENMSHNVLHGKCAGNRGRFNGLYGERHPSSKLTAELVGEIRRMSAEGRSQRYLASAFGVNRASIHDIVRRKTWQTV